MAIAVRKSEERGHFDHGWLNTYHTFSFGEYQDPNFMGFRTLRVINEDRVQPGCGFPLHAHQDMEIFSIIIEGGLAHQDDMGNGTILRPGHIQLMTAGTGITHAEYNASDKEEVHFLQIWIRPNAHKLKPSYQEKFFPPSDQHNQWCLIISHDGREGSLHIHQDADIYLATLDEGKALDYSFKGQRFGWIQIIQGKVEVNGVVLGAGDGAAISQIETLHFEAQSHSNLMWIDLA